MPHEQRPALTAGNRIYLYNLLRQAIGCGKQTFMTRVEEALAADDLAPQDLGFADARELMEELSEFVQLTVFKGGRVYVALVAQPAWDEALDAAAKKPAAGQGKPWKRKRGDKTVKPVRPRHVPRIEEEPAPEAEPVAVEEAAPEAEPLASEEPADAEAVAEDPESGRTAVEAHGEAVEATVEAPAQAESQAAASVEEVEALDAKESAAAEQADGTAGADLVADAPEAVAEEPSADEDAVPEEPAPAAVPPAPSISLTITYIPEDLEADAQDAASPQVGAAAAGETAEPAAQASPAGPDPVPENLIPRNDGELPEGFPRDFAQDVYCPAPLLRELGYLLPYGADALGILTEYYYIAHLRGELEHGRGQASFPLRYTQSGERRSVTVRIRRRAQGTPGAPWEVSELEDPTAEDSAPAN